MRTLVLDGTDEKNGFHVRAKKILSAELYSRGWPVTWMELEKMKIGNCIGCGKCSFDSPGVCIRNDDMESIFRELVQSRLLLFFTPILFGSYHWRLKKAVDRFIPLLVPRYTIRGGELHHELRYRRMPRLAGIGLMDRRNEGQARTFHALVERNTLNTGSLRGGSLVLEDSESDRKGWKGRISSFMGMMDKGGVE